MSFPKISLSFNNENSEKLPNKIISNYKFQKILNKSIGIGTNDNDKNNFSKRTLITSLNKINNFTEPNTHRTEFDCDIPKYHSSRNSKIKLNFPIFI